MPLFFSEILISPEFSVQIFRTYEIQRIFKVFYIVSFETVSALTISFTFFGFIVFIRVFCNARIFNAKM
ncbi:hypothetical protein IV02_04690 [Pseudomonas syringae]|uniref:Uncharacterized protein n=1 Tax=Pseudomonas syringae TaxID=317 RepID=A0A085VF34_PSESX|nr:hypothetical protein IV02_04690 [Pseudomonas syringae]